jgi:hypothetical protein
VARGRYEDLHCVPCIPLPGRCFTEAGVSFFGEFFSSNPQTPVQLRRLRKQLELQQVLSRGMSHKFVIFPAGKKVTVIYGVVKR